MGIFDFLKSKSQPPAGPALDKKVAGPAKVVADRHSQSYDRLEAIDQLTALKSVDAAKALLKRFSYQIDPSITDQEEKDAAYAGVVGVGEEVVPAIEAYCKKAEGLRWPLRMLRELLEDQDYEDSLVTMLGDRDTEYVRNVEPKVQLIVALGELKSDAVRESVEPFLDDVNETVRFHAVESTFSQDDDAAVEPLIALLEREESVRIKNKVCEGFRTRDWVVPENKREDVTKALRDVHEYGLGDDGKIVGKR